MKAVGKVESLWRYPIKSMAGETLPGAFIGYAGVYGDRMYAVSECGRAAGISVSDGARSAADGAVPAALSKSRNRVDAAQSIGGAQNTASFRRSIQSLAELDVDVETPSGQLLAADDPALLAMLAGESRRPAGR